MLIGVKSSALALGDRTKPVLTAFATVMVAGLSLTGHLTDQTWPYYTAVVATAAHLFHQVNGVSGCCKMLGDGGRVQRLQMFESLVVCR